MPAGACIIKRTGPRGSVWYVKYTDASSRQVKERLGRVDEGWTKRRAEAELRARVVAVEKDGYKRPDPVTFETFASEWLEGYIERKGLKRSTAKSYRQCLVNHLVPAFRSTKIADIDVLAIERLITTMRRSGLSGATTNRSLNVLSLVLKAAVTRGLAPLNVVSLVDRPKEERRRWRIFTPAEIAAVEAAFIELIEDAEEDRDRDDLVACRVRLARASDGARVRACAGGRCSWPTRTGRSSGSRRPSFARRQTRRSRTRGNARSASGIVSRANCGSTEHDLRSRATTTTSSRTRVQAGRSIPIATATCSGGCSRRRASRATCARATTSVTRPSRTRPLLARHLVP